jgi:DNA-binding response OmpR family regulator
MYKILLIEDDQNMIDAIVDNFEYEKEYRVDGFSNSTDALKKLKKEHYHLVLLDYYLKNENGYEVLKKIRSINASIFICFLTGFSDKINPNTAFKMDIQGYIDKNGGFVNIINSIKSSVHSAYSAEKRSEYSTEKFCIRLKKLREKNNLSQKDLADLLGLGRTAISNYETGLNEPSITILVKMATIFQTSTDYLIGRTD